MRLLELLNKANIKCDLDETELLIDISNITDDSRRIENGSLFVAVSGEKYDGHVFLSDAVEKGASALIVEREIPKYPRIPIIKVPDTREALAILSHVFYNFPSKDITCVGYTGTNGKTTGTYIVENIMIKAFGAKVGRLGTVEYKLGDEVFVASNTTPSPLTLAGYFDKMNKKGIKHVVMEVSSHGLEQKRVLGIRFKVGVFTNLTQDHLDFHKNLNNYREAKWKLFSDYVAKEKDGVAVFNLDDETGRLFSKRYAGRQITYAMNQKADCVALDWSFTPNKTIFKLVYFNKEIEIESSLVGLFNVSNILGAFAAGLALDIPADVIKEGIKDLKKIPGRFESVNAGQPFFVVVDYSHTPDALRVALENARAVCNGRIIVVFGCGGNRDKTKRPIMGKTVGDAEGVEYVILTNDNPRNENPVEIAKMAEDGLKNSKVKKYDVILDRREAIHAAIKYAQKNDLVLLAGKGHEDYQIIGETKYPFDDRIEALKFLETIKWK